MRNGFVEQAIRQDNFLGMNEKSFFSKIFDDIEINLTLKNNIELEDMDEAEEFQIILLVILVQT